MHFLLVKVIGCKVIQVLRSIFVGQNRGPYNRGVLYKHPFGIGDFNLSDSSIVI